MNPKALKHYEKGSKNLENARGLNILLKNNPSLQGSYRNQIIKIMNQQKKLAKKQFKKCIKYLSDEHSGETQG